MTRWRVRAAPAVALVVALAVACGGDDGASDDVVVLPVVAQIEPAIAAVEADLGGPQRYVEINATSQLVNLFVAVDGDETGAGDEDAAGDEAVPYLYVDGRLQAPAPPVPVDGMPTFAATDLDLDPDEVLDDVVSELPNSAFGLFVVTAAPNGGGVRYEVLARSAQGGTLAVSVTGDGSVLGVEPLDAG